MAADAATKVAACVKHKGGRKHWKCILPFVVVVVVVATIITLRLIWPVLRPVLRHKNPDFTLKDMYLSSSTAPTLPSVIQTTISTLNPNKRIAIYYDKLDVHLVYRTQQITFSTMIPPSYQGHKDEITWSPILHGNNVPLSPVLNKTMSEDILAGIVPVNVKASGIVRWKFGTWIFRRSHMNVNCPTNIYFGKKDGAYIASPEIKYPLVEVEGCQVEF